MVRLADIEGVGEKYAQKLEAAGVRNTKTFLEMGATRQGRKGIAEKTGISEKLILEWLNHVDLGRIQGVGSEYSDLLEAAGVDTVAELANRNADNLYQALQTANAAKQLVRRLPTRAQIEAWVTQAKTLPKIITY